LSSLVHKDGDAIVIRNVVKHFKKNTIRREYTTFKSELVRWLRGQRAPGEKVFIEALRGIDLTIARGQTVGIIGRNGSGKSTLLKLMTGIYAPTSGEIEMRGRISALLELGAGFHPDFSGRENIIINGIILGMTRAEIRGRMDEIIAFSELGDFVDEPVRTYSSGMYARLAFAVATHVDPDILIVDEVLAVGDEHFSKKSLAKMMEFKAAGKTIVIVTHELGTVERWCDLAVWVDAGRIRRIGPPREVTQEYRQAVALAEAQSMTLGPAALAKDGGALPEVVTPVPETGPAPSPQTRWGTYEVEISGVRFSNHKGEVQSLDTEEPLDIAIGYTARKPVEDVGFGIAILDSQGNKVYGTNTFIERVQLPTPLPPAGTVRLSLKRVGLTPGEYTLDVSAHPAQGKDYDYHRGLYRFTVHSAIADTGVARPPHVWSFESTPVAETAPPRRVAEV
jgi:lipopolysaccharide transport system ATP-binding protein